VYRYGCIKDVKRIKEVKLSSSLSAKKADSTDASTEDDTLQSCDDVTFRTCARSLTERHEYDGFQMGVMSKRMRLRTFARQRMWLQWTSEQQCISYRVLHGATTCRGQCLLDVGPVYQPQSAVRFHFESYISCHLIAELSAGMQNLSRVSE